MQGVARRATQPYVSEIEGTPGKTVFLFPGQGTPYPGMAASHYEAEPSFRNVLERGIAFLRERFNLDIEAALLDASTDRAVLAATENAQPALFLFEYALARLCMENGVHPDAMIGHSVGEFAAAGLSGVFGFEEGLSLVATRGRLIQSLPTGSMLAIKASAASLADLPPAISIAALNAPKMTTVSGPRDDVYALRERLENRGVRCRLLETSHAFHSSAMEPIRTEFTAAVRAVRLSAGSVPYASNVSGTWIQAEEATDPEYWYRHLREPVRFMEGLRCVGALGVSQVVELGPGSTLTSLAKRVLDRDSRRVYANPTTGSSDEGGGVAFAEILARLRRPLLRGGGSRAFNRSSISR